MFSLVAHQSALMRSSTVGVTEVSQALNVALFSTSVNKNQKSTEKVMLVTGATGEFAPGLIVQAISQGYKVVACSRRKQISKNPEFLQWIQVNENGLGNSESWNAVLDRIGKQVDQISAVNLIGASVPPPGKKLEDVNVRPALGLYGGLKAYAADNPNKTVVMVHMSSICASVLGNAHSYAAMRKYVDDTITTDMDRVNAVVFRPGLIFNDLCDGNMVNMGHPYSPEQFATLPIHPVIGSGNQIQQPVYQRDLVDAIVNACSAEHDEIIDAVGPESMTQAEMFEFFVKLRGGKFRMVRIPYNFGHVMAKHFPKGRIAPYSIAAFERLDDPEEKPLSVEPFQSYVGHPLSSMAEVYGKVKPEDGPIILARPPILAHIRDIAWKMLSLSAVRREVFEATLQDGPQIASEITKAFLNRD